MSKVDVSEIENEENKTPDKKQIEAEEKEIMLKTDTEKIEPVLETKPQEEEGPVKAALSSNVTDEGREVKPKFIPIGAIKMPGFFTRNADKDKDKNKEEDGQESDADKDKAEGAKPKRHRLQFLHACPFTQFLHHPRQQGETSNAEDPNNTRKSIVERIRAPLSNVFNKGQSKDAEAALASMETLEDKLDTPNDGMENIKLGDETDEGKVATKLPLRERIRQRKFIIDDIVVGVVVLLVLLLVIVGVVIGAHAGPPAERPLRAGRYITTITSCGHVEGILDDGVYKFYGIPYAAPSTGERRFSYAQPLNNMSLCQNETLQAHEPAPVCLQFLENGTTYGEEDCLTLDIVTPHVRYDSPLPVVVLIGANSLAGGLSPLQPSALYSRTKEVVFVKPNFRLGPFGFLALDVLSNTRYPATSGNYALGDLLVALQWVQHNIKHFGGDAESVTLLAHRAGATLAAALTTIKKAQKLYSRVWLSSPSVIYPGEPLDQAQKSNEILKQRTSCNDADCLRRIPTMEILAATPDTWLEGSASRLPVAGEFRRSWLVLDGDLLRVHPYDVWDAQRTARLALEKEKDSKPIVFGTTQHSAHTDLLRMKHLNWTSDIVEGMVNASVIGENNLTASVFSHFNKTYEGLVELISAVRTLCPLVSLARIRLSAPMYVVLGAGAGGGATGSRIAGVNADVEAILGTFDSDTPEQRRYMSAMQQLFYYFVWHGQLPGPETKLIAVGQDLLALRDQPICDLLIQKDIVPRYAHVD